MPITFHIGRRADRPERLALLDNIGTSHALFPIDWTREQVEADLRAARFAEGPANTWTIPEVPR